MNYSLLALTFVEQIPAISIFLLEFHRILNKRYIKNVFLKKLAETKINKILQ